MKVFVVAEIIQCPTSDVAYGVIGVCTTLEKARKKMIKCHTDYSYIVQPKYKSIDDTLCLIIYDCFGVEERHFVIIEEKDVED
jgi:hypothetical protein